MTSLYNEFPAYNEDYLKVSDLHEVYYEESGSPRGKPVVVLHGGPGSKSKPKYRRFFNPKKYRVVMFDQRGCGKSKPMGETKENTTWNLVRDAERIRKHLGIKKWVVFGGSWGSTLGLAYSEKHPSSVSGIILRGVWLGDKKGVEWLLHGKALRKLFPDLWELRVGYLEEEGIDPEKPLEKLHKMLVEGDMEQQKSAARIFENWSDQFMKIDQECKLTEVENVEERDIASKRILIHYVVNDFFLKPNQLIKKVNKLPNVPTVIVHGRYDVITPIDNAWKLRKKLPNSKLEIISAAGHHPSEPGIFSKLVEWTDKLAD